MSDNKNGGPVSHRRQKRAKKNKPVQAAAFPSVFVEEVGYVDTSEAGNTILKALELLQEAAQSAEGRARWEAWQILQNEVDGLRQGKVPMRLDVAAQPLLFVAAQAVSAWIDAFAPIYLPEGQKPAGSRQSGQKGGKP